MSTAISETNTKRDEHAVLGVDLEPRVVDVLTADADLGVETIPRVRRTRRSVARPRAMYSARGCSVDRRPGGARPRGAVIGYDGGTRVPEPRRPRVTSAQARVEQARVGFAVLAAASLLTALIVVGMIVLAHVRAGTWGGEVTTPAPSVVDGQTWTEGAVGSVPR